MLLAPSYRRSLVSYPPVVPASAVPEGFDPSARGLALEAEEHFEGGSWRRAEWCVYANAVSTNKAGAWQADHVGVVATSDPIHPWALQFKMEKLPARQTYSWNGFSYQRVGGAAHWKGPSDGALGAAFKPDGLWRSIHRFVGLEARADQSLGYGWANLLWPNEGAGSGNLGWPRNGEPDICEMFPTNVSKFGGESNWHLDTVVNSSRHTRQPPSASTLAGYPGLFSNVPPGDVSRGNYGVDWAAGAWHVVDCLVKVGQCYEVYVDGVFKGRINSTTDPPSYVIGPSISLPMRWTMQTEFLGVSDLAAAAGSYAIQVAAVQYWSWQ